MKQSGMCEDVERCLSGRKRDPGRAPYGRFSASAAAGASLEEDCRESMCVFCVTGAQIESETNGGRGFSRCTAKVGTCGRPMGESQLPSGRLTGASRKKASRSQWVTSHGSSTPNGPGHLDQYWRVNNGGTSHQNISLFAYTSNGAPSWSTYTKPHAFGKLCMHSDKFSRCSNVEWTTICQETCSRVEHKEVQSVQKKWCGSIVTQQFGFAKENANVLFLNC
ncbi:hypothetical protein MRX96_002015 [Rhipicephalus microplus]